MNTLVDIPTLYEYEPTDATDRSPLLFEQYLKYLEGEKECENLCGTANTSIVIYTNTCVNYNDLYNDMLECSQKGSRYICLGLFIGDRTEVTLDNGETIERPDNGHAMAIIIDLKDRTFELFDPYGVPYDQYTYGCVREFVDHINSQNINNEFKYYDNTRYSKQIQRITNNDNYCVYWSLMYIQLRLLNNNLSRHDIINHMTSFNAIELMDRIKRYTNLVSTTLN